MSEKIQARAIIDTVAVYFPLFSAYKAPQVKASNGVSFWRYNDNNHWYTTTELSRYTADGRYTSYVTDDNSGLKNKVIKLPPHRQNNTNSPTANGVCAAIDRLYDGYQETIFPGERASFDALLSDTEHYYHYTPKVTRLDIALDLPPSVIPTPLDLLYYVRHGRGSGARRLQVAAKQGLYKYDKKTDTWQLIQRDKDGKTKAVSTRPYFLRSAQRLKKAILKNEITVYIGTRNGEIKIYTKGGLVRYELSARKSILRHLMPDRRVAALSDPFVLSHLFRAAAERIGELYRHTSRYGLYRRAAKQAIDLFVRNFLSRHSREASYHTRPAPTYNNVFVFMSRPLAQRERPPPF